jgi:Tol biopolymer transport system component
MGEVYRAADSRLGRDVAIKVSAAQFTERFEREARAVAALNHPNICTLHDVGPNYLVMEYVEGESPKGPLPLDEALRIARQIADALESAHEKGIVHRDLKPANIKIKPDGTVKVLDFGLAKQTTPGAESGLSTSPTMSMAATQAGVILGTAAYMAPEQARGRMADKRADIWAFGVVLYEMLAGEPLFQGEDVTEVLASVVKEAPTLEKVPVQVRRLLRKCLEKDPKKRLRDIGDAWELLDQPQEVSAPAVPSRLRLNVWALAAGALAFALAALGFVHYRETPAPQLTQRYTIPLPEEGSLIDRFRFEVSPNGRYVVMTTLASGKRQLLLRPLDALEALPMPGTDDATSPFWSPDSRWIGFFAFGQLRKIAVSGGPAQTICNSGSRASGTWNRDDVILFSNNGKLQRVSATANGDTPVNVMDGTLSAAAPYFLPDGRHFLYSVSAVLSSENSGIYFGSLDGKENRRILGDYSSTVFVPSGPGKNSGHIVFARENTLVAQPFDATTGKLGDAVLVGEGVSRIGFGYSPVSVSNGTLVYLSLPANAQPSQIVWYDRKGDVQELVSKPGTVAGPSISPDQKTVAFSRLEGRSSDLWLWRVAHKTDQPLTSDEVRNDTPAWSPGSDRIAYRSNRTSVQQIWLKAVNGTGKDEMLVTDTNNKFPSQWTRDGLIVYSDNASETRIDIWYIPLEGGDRKPIKFISSKSDDAQGQISPDGKWMAYMSDKTGTREVYVVQFPSGEGEERISTAGGEQPRWKGDGSELYYVASDGKMMSVAVKTTAGPKPALDHGAPVVLFDSHISTSLITRAFQYDVTPDGKRFLVATNASSGQPRVGPLALTVVTNWTPGK